MQVLSWRAKHGTYLYDASTSEKLEASARMILKELMEDGWMYRPTPPEANPADQEILSLTDEQVAALPERLRQEAVQIRREHALEQAQYEEEMEEWREAEAILAGTAEPELIRARADYSDEDWERILERVPQWHLAEVREDGVYRPPTAWRMLQDRSGYEYEDYRLERVIEPEVG